MGAGLEAVLSIIFWALVVYCIFYCCCKKRKDRGVVFTTVQPVPAETTRTVIGQNGTVTTISSGTAYVASQAPYPVQQGPYGAAPGVVPYPGQVVYPAPPYPTGQTPYAAVPYPTYAAGMPQPYQGVPGVAVPPYPAAPNPPPYDQLISHEGYQKQAPYNPHFSGN